MLLLKLKLFPPGKHTDSNGVAREFTQDELMACAAAYSPGVFEAPIVDGHPADGETMVTRYGAVQRLAFEDGYLTPYAGESSSFLIDRLNRGEVRYFSPSFYLPDHPNNPTPGQLYLRHVGVVNYPAVKGQPLPELSYSDNGQAVTVNFCECKLREVIPMPQGENQNQAPAQPVVDFTEQHRLLDERARLLAAKELELEKQATEMRRAGVVQFAESLAQAGRILPKDMPGLVGFMLAVPADSQVVQFAEGGTEQKMPADTWLRGFLSNLPKQVEFAELTKPDGKALGVDDELKQMAEGIAKGAK